MFQVELEDFPRGSEFNLGRLGVVRAHRHENTQKPYAECKSEEQVIALKKILGLTGPPIVIKEEKSSPGLITHDKTVAQAKAVIDGAQNRADLVELQDSELRHPQFPGGRPRVLNLIQQRLDQVRNQ